jgi:NAD dependent epimerase/dehydratase family enzyme
VTIRTGLVLAGGSPLLTLLAASSRAGGGRLGAGTQHFPWIGIDDLTDIYHRAAVDPALSGPVNAVAPEDITEAEFAATLADLQRVRVPLRIPVPAAGPRILLGALGADELALADQHARPDVLERAGHPFRTTTVRDLLRHELG